MAPRAAGVLLAGMFTLFVTEVVLAPLWVWIWPGETPSVGTLVGGAIVICALAGWAMTPDTSP